jgi:pilus assembly protein Flp/PilA
MFVRKELVNRPLICARRGLYKDHRMTLLARFAADESGATAIEYGLLVTGLSVTILVILQSIGTNMRTMLERIAAVLS